MPNGQLHSGKTHSKSSVRLFHYKELNKAYKTLKNNKIIFDNPVDAAKHINRVWHKIDLWWNEKEVIKARNLFLKEFNLPPKNKLLDIFRCLKIFKKV